MVAHTKCHPDEMKKLTHLSQSAAAREIGVPISTLSAAAKRHGIKFKAQAARRAQGWHRALPVKRSGGLIQKKLQDRVNSVLTIMSDGRWRTSSEIAERLNISREAVLAVFRNPPRGYQFQDDIASDLKIFQMVTKP